MKKTYKTRYTGYEIYVRRGEKVELIQFKKQLVPNNVVGSTYVTEDKELQALLEAHKNYGLYFWTDDKEEVAPKKVKQVKTEE